MIVFYNVIPVVLTQNGFWIVRIIPPCLSIVIVQIPRK